MFSYCLPYFSGLRLFDIGGGTHSWEERSLCSLRSINILVVAHTLPSLHFACPMCCVVFACCFGAACVVVSFLFPHTPTRDREKVLNK